MSATATTTVSSHFALLSASSAYRHQSPCGVLHDGVLCAAQSSSTELPDAPKGGSSTTSSHTSAPSLALPAEGPFPASHLTPPSKASPTAASSSCSSSSTATSADATSTVTIPVDDCCRVPPELRGAEESVGAWTGRLLLAAGEARAAEEFDATSGFTFTDRFSSIAVEDPKLELRCRSDRDATCFTQQWFFGAMGLRAEFRCTPVAGGGVVGVGILAHQQRMASSEHLLGTAGFLYSVGCLLLGGAVWVMFDGRAVHVETRAVGPEVSIVLVVTGGTLRFEVDGSALEYTWAPVEGLDLSQGQFRLGASMNRTGQRVRLVRSTPLNDWGAPFTFRNSCPWKFRKEGPRWSSVGSVAEGTLYSYQTFGGGDSVSLKARVQARSGSGMVGIGVLDDAVINHCPFHRLGGSLLYDSIGLLLYDGKLIVSRVNDAYVLPLPFPLPSEVVLQLAFSAGWLTCTVNDHTIRLPDVARLRLRLHTDVKYRLGISISGTDQWAEVLASSHDTVSAGAPRRAASNSSRSDRESDDHDSTTGNNRSFNRCYKTHTSIHGTMESTVHLECWPAERFVCAAPFRLDRCAMPAIQIGIGTSPVSLDRDDVIVDGFTGLRSTFAGREYIAPLQDLFVEAGSIWVVTVATGGPCLADTLRQWRSAGAWYATLQHRFNRCKAWTRQLLLGVSYLERCGLEHTDLTPANIVFTPSVCDDGAVRIMGLGSCRLRQSRTAHPDTSAVFAIGRIAVELLTLEPYTPHDMVSRLLNVLMPLHARQVKEFVGAIRQLLAPPESRCTAAEALNAPWCHNIDPDRIEPHYRGLEELC